MRKQLPKPSRPSKIEPMLPITARQWDALIAIAQGVPPLDVMSKLGLMVATDLMGVVATALWNLGYEPGDPEAEEFGIDTRFALDCLPSQLMAAFAVRTACHNYGLALPPNIPWIGIKGVPSWLGSPQPPSTGNEQGGTHAQPRPADPL